MQVEGGLRERKKRRTRDAIASAALALFAERGFAAATVEQIAAAADVSPRTFFRYFPTKEDAALADHGRRLAAVREALASGDADEPTTEPVRRAVLAMLEDVVAAPAEGLVRSRIVLGEPSVMARSLELQAVYEDAIAREVAARLGVDVDVDPRPRVVAGAALGALRAAMRAWVASDGASDPRETVTLAFEVLEHGLDTDRAPDARV
jgi:AcrR family transcriptional regulator